MELYGQKLTINLAGFRFGLDYSHTPCLTFRKPPLPNLEGIP